MTHQAPISKPEAAKLTEDVVGVDVSRLVRLVGEPEKQGRYYWREKETDEWKPVRVWWIDDMMREGWSYMLGRFEDSEHSVDMRKLPKGQWAKDSLPNSELSQPKPE